MSKPKTYMYDPKEDYVLKYLSRNDLELIGNRVITAYRKLPEVAAAPFTRVDIDYLVETLLGLRVDYQHLSRNRTYLGATSYEEIGIEVFPDDVEDDVSFYMLDGKTLLIESDLMLKGACIGRRNFTVAHEGCHHILRMLFPKCYGVGAKNRKVHYFRSGKASNHDWEEWQVDVLASTLLLPSECVYNNMRAFGLGGEMRLLNRVFAPREYVCFEEMAAHMGVSKTALSIRMQRLGLLKRSDLGDPYALVRIENTEEETIWQNNKCVS